MREAASSSDVLWAGAALLIKMYKVLTLMPRLRVTSPWLVKDKIQASIYYDAQMWSIWKALRPVIERIAFTLASYNTGPGNIIKAQRLVTQPLNSNYW